MRQPATCNTTVTVPFRQTYLPDSDVFCELIVSVRQVGITKITKYKSIKEFENTKHPGWAVTGQLKLICSSGPQQCRTLRWNILEVLAASRPHTLPWLEVVEASSSPAFCLAFLPAVPLIIQKTNRPALIVAAPELPFYSNTRSFIAPPSIPLINQNSLSSSSPWSLINDQIAKIIGWLGTKSPQF